MKARILFEHVTGLNVRAEMRRKTELKLKAGAKGSGTALNRHSKQFIQKLLGCVGCIALLLLVACAHTDPIIEDFHDEQSRLNVTVSPSDGRPNEYTLSASIEHAVNSRKGAGRRIETREGLDRLSFPMVTVTVDAPRGTAQLQKPDGSTWVSSELRVFRESDLVVAEYTLKYRDGVVDHSISGTVRIKP